LRIGWTKKQCISINNDDDTENIQLVDENNYYGFILTTIGAPNTFEIFSSDTPGNVLITSNEEEVRTTSEIILYHDNEVTDEILVNTLETDKPAEINKQITKSDELTKDELKELADLEDNTNVNIIKFNNQLIKLLTPSSLINTISNNSNLVDATTSVVNATTAVANAISAVANALGKLKSPSDITHTKDTELKNRQFMV